MTTPAASGMTLDCGKDLIAPSPRTGRGDQKITAAITSYAQPLQHRARRASKKSTMSTSPIRVFLPSLILLFGIAASGSRRMAKADDAAGPTSPNPGLCYYYPTPPANPPRTIKVDVCVYGGTPAGVGGGGAGSADGQDRGPGGLPPACWRTDVGRAHGCRFRQSRIDRRDGRRVS